MGRTLRFGVLSDAHPLQDWAQASRTGPADDLQRATEAKLRYRALWGQGVSGAFSAKFENLTGL